jgi:glycosyltransferase involved in cell wall biosynthesis
MNKQDRPKRKSWPGASETARPVTVQDHRSHAIASGATSRSELDMPPRLAFWAFNYMPKWEAVSKEIRTLASHFHERYGTRTISLNVRGEKVAFFGRDKYLPLPWSLVGLPLLIRMARNLEVNHVFASPAEWLLTPRLARLGNTILTISKDSPALNRFEKNIGMLRCMRYVVVESERHHDMMLQAGIERARLKLIYPGVARRPYRKPPEGPFTLLFATSPLGRHDLLSRGIHLMVRAAARLPDVRFRLIWRRPEPPELSRLIRDAGVGNVEVISGYIDDMKSLYDDAHAVILPGLSATSLKPCPHSALESLAHGKPVLVSRPASLSAIVAREGCGVVFEPNIESLCEGTLELMQNYAGFQERAHAAVERNFSREVFLDRYRKLYASMLEPRH